MLARSAVRFAVLTLAALALAPATSADPRPWTFSIDAYPEGRGNVEFEHYTTWEHHSKDEPGYDRFRFREELEIGITDYFDIAIYMANWNYEDSGSKKGTQYEASGIEGVVYLSKPTDFIGVALYGEVLVGESGREYEFEQKLILHKDIGNWSFVYNLVIETEIEREDGENEVEGVLGHTFGVSYRVNKNWRVGAELTVESVYVDWSDYEKTEVYAGPNFSYVGNGIPGTKANWWITVTPMFQLSSHDDSVDYLVRAIIGIEF
jgi:hypothetical protein